MVRGLDEARLEYWRRKSGGKGCGWTNRSGSRLGRFLNLNAHQKAYVAEEGALNNQVQRMTCLVGMFLYLTKSLGPQTEWDGERWKLCLGPETGLPLTQADLSTATAECSLQRLDLHYAVIL